MRTKTKATVAGGLVMALAGLAGCGSSSKPSTTTTPPGLANPASVFCEQQGGKVDIVNGTGGQQGICVLPDGTRVDEWQYFYAHGGTTTTT